MNIQTMPMKGISRAMLLTALLVISLSGCTGVGNFIANMGNPPPSPTQYYQWITSASEQEVAEAKAGLEAEQDNPENSIATIQLAMLLSVPGEVTVDQLDMAREILTLSTQETQSAATGHRELEYRRFGAIWLSYLQSHEDHRITASESEEYQNQVQSLTEKIEELEQQIEALTTIEQRLIERERGQNPQ